MEIIGRFVVFIVGFVLFLPSISDLIHTFRWKSFDGYLWVTIPCFLLSIYLMYLAFT